MDAGDVHPVRVLRGARDAGLHPHDRSTSAFAGTETYRPHGVTGCGIFCADPAPGEGLAADCDRSARCCQRLILEAQTRSRPRHEVARLDDVVWLRADDAAEDR